MSLVGHRYADSSSTHRLTSTTPLAVAGGSIAAFDPSEPESPRIPTRIRGQTAHDSKRLTSYREPRVVPQPTPRASAVRLKHEAFAHPFVPREARRSVESAYGLRGPSSLAGTTPCGGPGQTRCVRPTSAHHVFKDEHPNFRWLAAELRQNRARRWTDRLHRARPASAGFPCPPRGLFDRTTRLSADV